MASIGGLPCHVPVSLQSYRISCQQATNRKAAEAPMIDQQFEIPTKDGHTTTFVTHPERGGPHPVILFYMDAPAIREELRDMARRLRPIYDRDAAKRHWERLLALYHRNLWS
jgi:hypothetical protein